VTKICALLTMHCASRPFVKNRHDGSAVVVAPFAQQVLL